MCVCEVGRKGVGGGLIIVNVGSSLPIFTENLEDSRNFVLRHFESLHKF